MKDKWLVKPDPKPEAKMSLFCFPYAGGGLSTYLDWASQLPSYVELIIVQPPGRGARVFEPAYTEMQALVTQLKTLVKGELNRPYVFYGHSMGSGVAFELMHQLQAENLTLPNHYVASAGRPPHYNHKEKLLHLLDEQGFIDALEELQETPNEALKHKDLAEIFIPKIKADFELIENYHFTGELKLDCPATIMAGKLDRSISESTVMKWPELFTQPVDIKWIEGNHFFIYEHQQAVLQALQMIFDELLENKEYIK